jgi:ClpP class serine protease
MSSWAQLIDELGIIKDPEKADWLKSKLDEALESISQLRSERNVILYASAFLQKPAAGFFTMMQPADINGFLASLHEIDCSKGLSLILHTPGGASGAVETIVEYLKNKFENFEVIIPTYALSAGTMVSLASSNLIMGKHSQLSPIDSQLGGIHPTRMVSARAIESQFKKATTDIMANSDMALVWAPILPSFGPALLQEAKNALDYGERLVEKWLKDGMFKDKENRDELAKKVAEYFNDKDSIHGFHGKRIGIQEVKELELTAEYLEDDSDLQDAVLTLYHLITIIFDNSPTVRMMANSNGKHWVQNMVIPQRSNPS